jgi:glycine/D-amino acid oxidase-like deaminating enzyme
MSALQTPKAKSYDVVLVGGAMYGASIAWFLSDNPDFDGSILVVERDPTYEFASTSHTNSCIRQQFSREINVRVSQFGVEFIRNFRQFMGGDPRIPEVVLHSFGYLYLADSQRFAGTLQKAQKMQASLGAGTRFMSRNEIAQAYPFYNLDGIIGANHNLVDEG